MGGFTSLKNLEFFPSFQKLGFEMSRSARIFECKLEYFLEIGERGLQDDLIFFVWLISCFKLFVSPETQFTDFLDLLFF